MTLLKLNGLILIFSMSYMDIGDIGMHVDINDDKRKEETTLP